MSDLKEIIRLIPKRRNGKWFCVAYENGVWYAGWPTLDGDFSADLYTTDRDIEGACLHLLSEVDKESAKS